MIPFGLCNAPSTFQVSMNEIFQHQLRKIVLVFFDDILIYSQTWPDHIRHLREVFEILKLHHFYIKPNKRTFGESTVEYLGHVINAEGVKVDQSKIKAMQEWAKPRMLIELRGFFGLTGYYRKFVKNYGTIAKPLTEMTKKGKF